MGYGNLLNQMAGSPFTGGFGRLKVADITPIFESKQVGDNDPLQWDEKLVSGSGTFTYDQDKSLTRLAVSDSTAGVVVRQSRQRGIYFSGKGLGWVATFTAQAPAAGITRRIGYFDDNDGIFLEISNLNVRWVVRSSASGSPVDTVFERADWNGEKLQAEGDAPHIVIDWSKSQIIWSDMEWLGVGAVDMGFRIKDRYHACHSLHHANKVTEPYIKNPNLPIRYELRNDGTGPAATLDAICSSVMAEGAEGESGLERGANRGATGLTNLSAGTIYPLFAIRKAAGFEGAFVVPSSFDITIDATEEFNWMLIANPTLDSGAFSWSAVDGSVVEVDGRTDNGETVSGGWVLKSGTLRTTQQSRSLSSDSKIPRSIGVDIDGASEIYVLAIQQTATGNHNYKGSINWREIR